MSNRNISFFSFFVFIGLITSCNTDSNVANATNNNNSSTTKFELVSPKSSGVSFKNEITESNQFNVLNYAYMYSGGGVAVGDINNDGLDDIYFTSNQSSNKLYLNKGDMKFEDITESAGVKDQKGWSNGVTMVDLNNDGYLDIYVCKSGSLGNDQYRKNKLFINNKDNTFSEKSRSYGLDDAAYSTQAYFFDYDKDGDLDLFLVNHRKDWAKNTIVSTESVNTRDRLHSDQFYRNDNGKFKNITREAGIGNNAWGLSGAIDDYNDDGWPDIYISNDYMEGDLLWINNQDGTFSNGILDIIDHISFYSMGSDVADINNDGMQDLFVLDMVASDHVKSKRNMASMDTKSFRTLVKIGFHHQYMTNTLHLKVDKGQYAEIANAAGIAKTDWSWSPLFADFDNDGWKDLIVTNGIARNITDNDFKIKVRELQASGKSISLEDIHNLMPTEKTPNAIYKNNGNTTFTASGDQWGVNQKVNSNGSAFADLDNDGDLDMIWNNFDDIASIYENKTQPSFIKVELQGPPKNRFGIGAEVILKTDISKQYAKQYITRGFLSSVSPIIHFGLGEGNPESITVKWPDGKVSSISNISENTTIEVDYNGASNEEPAQKVTALFRSKDPKSFGIDYKHQENAYDDFAKEILLPQMQSMHGPLISKGDINNDGLEDVYFSGAKGMAGQLMTQSKDGKFSPISQKTWNTDKAFEDTGSVFLDADGDGDQDLYIVSGGVEFGLNSPMLQDRLYFNDGNGNFTRMKSNLPKITSSGLSVVAGDIDADGDEDIIVGAKVLPGLYPNTPQSIILINNNGTFYEDAKAVAPGFADIGMVTDLMLSDIDKDEDPDLIVVGEWFEPTIFYNDKGKFTKESTNLPSGWWYSIAIDDLDNDGDNDMVLGNLGLNNKFHPSDKKPFHVYAKDFDNSGNLDIVLSKEANGELLPVRGRECSSQQMPFITDKFPTYQEFAEADLIDIYGDDNLDGATHFSVTDFASVVAINDGKGNFTPSPLPISAQYGPTLSLHIMDINKDGNKDIIGCGNIYETEVETVRYDGQKGFVLLGDGAGNYKNRPLSGFVTDGNVKDAEVINIKGKNHLLLSRNSDSPQIFEMD